MQLNFKLEPICVHNGSGLRLWGYEILLRSPIPNSLLFAVENPPLDMFIFENAMNFLRENGRKNFNYTANLRPSTLEAFGKEIKELTLEIGSKFNLYIELSESGGTVPTSSLAGLKIILDDFGQMESNLHRLLTYSPHGIKLEINILEMLKRDRHMWISNLVNTLKKDGRIVIGEKVETEIEFLTALEMGITYFQGRLIEKRLTTDTIQ